MEYFKYTDVKNHLSNISHSIDAALRSIEEELIEARDREEDKLPIYLTKLRKKALSSVYLKTKRKQYNSLEEITDYGGVRVLCLFEQDIIHAHNFIIKELICKKNLGFTLKEFCVFNWEAGDVEELRKIVIDNIHDIKPNEIKVSKKGSGYHSVHYIVEIGALNTCIEIQLRTLLQDAWGELEHALGYKQGGVHPYIRKNFKLLSQDLTTNDALISHLKDISEHERILKGVQDNNAGPFRFFSYSDNLRCDKFVNDNAIKKQLQDYEGYVKKESNQSNSKAWTIEALAKINNITDKFTATEAEKDKKFDYWLRMEKAYIYFHNGELKKAYKEYDNIINDKHYTNTYITYFRLGDVAMRLGNTVKALIAFDDAERLYDELNKKSKEQEIDGYYIKSNLAYLYWELGEQFYEAALKKITETKQIFDIIEKNLKQDDDRVEEKMLNHLCWYNLEVLSNESNKDKTTHMLQYTKEHYDKLVEILRNNTKTSINTLDTCAWFSYQQYLHLKANKGNNNTSEGNSPLYWIKQSNEFCKSIVSKDQQKETCTSFFDNDLIKSHYLTIQDSYNKYNFQ